MELLLAILLVLLISVVSIVLAVAVFVFWMHRSYMKVKDSEPVYDDGEEDEF